MLFRWSIYCKQFKMAEVSLWKLTSSWKINLFGNLEWRKRHRTDFSLLKKVTGNKPCSNCRSSGGRRLAYFESPANIANITNITNETLGYKMTLFTELHSFFCLFCRSPKGSINLRQNLRRKKRVHKKLKCKFSCSPWCFSWYNVLRIFVQCLLDELRH